VACPGDIMRSAPDLNPLKNQPYSQITPHNPLRRIIDTADIDAVAGAVVAGAGGFGTIRTFLAWTERVTISPVNSFEPVFLKVPMVAMVVLLDLCFRARTIAASMVIEGPEAIDGAPRRGSTAKEGLSCLARNDGAAGRGRKF